MKSKEEILEQIFDELQELTLEQARKTYSKTVIDHFTNPRNLGAMDEPDSFMYLGGMCGDTIGIFVKLDDDRISDISFVTNGCGPTIACSSALTCMAEGLTVDEAMGLKSEDLIRYLEGLPKENTHCADLAVNTLRAALAKVRKAE